MRLISNKRSNKESSKRTSRRKKQRTPLDEELKIQEASLKKGTNRKKISKGNSEKNSDSSVSIKKSKRRKRRINVVKEDNEVIKSSSSKGRSSKRKPSQSRKRNEQIEQTSGLPALYKGINKPEPISKSIHWYGKVSNIVISVLLALILIILIVFYVKVDRAEVVSGSMEPTLMINEKVTVVNGRDPKRFSLVVFYPPTSEKDKDKYVKRVIAIPGDEVTYKNDQLIINGDFYDEPYLDANKKKIVKTDDSKKTLYTLDFTLDEIPGVPKGTKKVPEGFYLVLGDNRQNSQDSRFIGLIPKENLIGTVWKQNMLPHKTKENQ